MADLLAWGASFKTAPLAVRERLGTGSAGEVEVGLEARAALGTRECVVISTCNRFELYIAPSPSHSARAWAESRFGVPLAGHDFSRTGGEAIRHMLRVAAGLESQVVGETQILGQVRRSYERAHAAGHTGPVLNPLFQAAFRTAREVHRTTRISDRKASVPAVAVSLAQRVFEKLDRRSALLVGAGETGRVAAERLRKVGVRDLVIANRTFEKAEELATEWGAKPLPLDRLADELHRFDIVVLCATVSEPLLDRPRVAAALARRRGEPQLILDLGVPRNAAPDIREIDGAFLYDLDGLHRSMEERARVFGTDVERAEGIIERAAREIAAREARGAPALGLSAGAP